MNEELFGELHEQEEYGLFGKEHERQKSNIGNVNNRYRVNVLHRGKERWKYCYTIERAKHLQELAKQGGLSSIIYQKTRGGYVVCGL